MPAQTLVIAECGSSWDLDLSKAERLINAAKECDAQIAKFQWTSNAEKMAARRGHPEWADGYRKWLMYPRKWLDELKAMCDKAGIEFAVTCYLIEDIATIAPLVKRFKVSAFEAKWTEFVDAHLPYRKQIIISNGSSSRTAYPGFIKNPCHIDNLLCVSKYPAALEDYDLKMLWPDEMGSDDGLSDHTANVLTGAAAVAAGARIVEAHIRLHDTDKGNPDYPHSLCAESGRLEIGVNGVVKESNIQTEPLFAEYVRNIRTIERML